MVENYLTLEQVAEKLQMTPHKIMKLWRDKQAFFNAIGTTSENIRFPESDLVAYLKGNPQPDIEAPAAPAAPVNSELKNFSDLAEISKQKKIIAENEAQEIKLILEKEANKLKMTAEQFLDTQVKFEQKENDFKTYIENRESTLETKEQTFALKEPNYISIIRVRDQKIKEQDSKIADLEKEVKRLKDLENKVTQQAQAQLSKEEKYKADYGDIREYLLKLLDYCQKLPDGKCRNLAIYLREVIKKLEFFYYDQFDYQKSIKVYLNAEKQINNVISSLQDMKKNIPDCDNGKIADYFGKTTDEIDALLGIGEPRRIEENPILPIQRK